MNESYDIKDINNVKNNKSSSSGSYKNGTVATEELELDEGIDENFCIVDKWGEGELSSLWAISNHYGVSIEEIKKLNPEIGDDNVIHPQQIIKLPKNNEVVKKEVLDGAGENSEEEINVDIKSQDQFVVVGKNKNSSLWEISQRYGVSIEEIKKLNPEIGDDNIIHPSQEIEIPLKDSVINDKVDVEEISEEKTKVKEVEETVINSANEKKVTESVDVTTSSSVGKTFSNYRVTSYHPGDDFSSGTVTGSGKSINDFETINIDGKRVYTYNGKIVVAAATNELFNSKEVTKNGADVRQEGKHYFNYYDEFTLTINGKNYDAIVLDSCGAAMWEGEYRIDLYVPSSSDIIDTTDVSISNV